MNYLTYIFLLNYYYNHYNHSNAITYWLYQPANQKALESRVSKMEGSFDKNNDNKYGWKIYNSKTQNKNLIQIFA